MIPLLSVIIGVCIFALAVYLFFTQSSTKSHFMNKSPVGYYYNTETNLFASAKDRTIGVNAAINLFKKDGATYTEAQFKTISDSFIIQLLEPNDETDLKATKAKTTVLLDPSYRSVFTLVVKAINTNRKFANDAERAAVFNILLKYFYIMEIQVPAPLNQWPDYILIRTFQTFKMPQLSELTLS
jgi:hypothetical protein